MKENPFFILKKTKPKKIKPLLDLTALCNIRECVLYDMGSLIAEYTGKVWPPTLGIRKVKLYCHKCRKDNVVEILIMDGKVVEIPCG